MSTDPFREQLQARGISPMEYVLAIYRDRGALIRLARESPPVFAEGFADILEAGNFDQLSQELRSGGAGEA